MAFRASQKQGQKWRAEVGYIAFAARNQGQDAAHQHRKEARNDRCEAREKSWVHFRVNQWGFWEMLTLGLEDPLGPQIQQVLELPSARPVPARHSHTHVYIIRTIEGRTLLGVSGSQPTSSRSKVWQGPSLRRPRNWPHRFLSDPHRTSLQLDPLTLHLPAMISPSVHHPQSLFLSPFP